jgi:glycosyltransferase involved in cell wall biosynthesis
LEPLVERLHAAMTVQGGSFEILLVNDASPDETWRIIENLCDRYPEVRGYDLARNVGQCRATLFGFEQAQGRLVLTMDDDFQHRPEDAPALFRALREHPDADCAIAAFGRREQGWHRRTGTSLMRWVYRLYGAPPGVEMNAFRVLTRDVSKAVCAYPMESDLLAPILLRVTRRIVKVDVPQQPRRGGKSAYGFFRLAGMAMESLVGLAGLRRSTARVSRCEIRRSCNVT